MATTDPRYYVREILYGFPITKDDDATPASTLHEYERGPEDLKDLFFSEGYDVIVKYGMPRVRSARQIQDVPVHFLMTYPVTVITTNKYDPVLGTLVSTATTLQAKARTAIRAAIGASAQSATPAYTLMIMREEGRNDWMGGINIWQTTYYIEYMTG